MDSETKRIIRTLTTGMNMLADRIEILENINEALDQLKTSTTTYEDRTEVLDDLRNK